MNDQNLKPIRKGDLTIEQSRERARNGGKRSVEVRKAKKTLAELFTAWADNEVKDKDKLLLKSLGIDDKDATNKALLIVPIIKNITKGDTKTLQLAIELLSEDKRKEKEIKKLEAEIKRLELEAEKLKKEINGELETERIVLINDVPKVD